MEPLPPIKEVEYRCVIGKAFDEILGMEYSTFSFETAKEFSSFRYEIAVRYRVEPGVITFRVLGMTATKMMMPSFGTAKSVLKIPYLPVGVYTVRFLKGDGSENQFMLEVKKTGVQLVKPIPRKRFIDIIIQPEAAAQGAKFVTTVTKIHTIPLTPRTIQKRQLAPPTPEELELLEALKTETPEERDAREEMELFGSRRKPAKKETKPTTKEKKANTAVKRSAAKKTTSSKSAAVKKKSAPARSAKSAPKKAAPKKKKR